jgi:hypothetical protein
MVAEIHRTLLFTYRGEALEARQYRQPCGNAALGCQLRSGGWSLDCRI